MRSKNPDLDSPIGSMSGILDLEPMSGILDLDINMDYSEGRDSGIHISFLQKIENQNSWSGLGVGIPDLDSDRESLQEVEMMGIRIWISPESWDEKIRSGQW